MQKTTNMDNLQNYFKARRKMLRYFEIVPETDKQKIFIEELHDLINYADKTMEDMAISINALKSGNQQKNILQYKKLCQSYRKLLEAFNIDPSLITEIDRH